MAEIIRNDPMAWIFLVGITLCNLGLVYVTMRYTKIAQEAANLALGIAPEATGEPHSRETTPEATSGGQELSGRL